MSLELRGVSVTYGRVEALKQVDLTVPEGQIVALIGANGAGKTTTLRAITGLARLRAGTVTWLGTRLDDLGTERIELVLDANAALLRAERELLLAKVARADAILRMESATALLPHPGSR